jgi:hypothetical protein
MTNQDSLTCFHRRDFNQEMGGTCSTYGEEEKCTQLFFFWSSILWDGDHLEHKDVDRRVILKTGLQEM